MRIATALILAGLLAIIMVLPGIASAQSVTLNILNTENPPGEILAIQGNGIEVEFIVTDATGTDKKDIIRLVRVSDDTVLVEKQRGVSTTGSSITLSMNSITNDTEVRVEYVLNSDGTTVVASVPGAGTLLKIVQDVGTSELLARIVVLESQVATLQTNLAAVQANSALSLGAYVEVDPDALNGLAGPHVIFNGANVSIQSGSGATDDNFTPSGLGNLIIGYNEDDDGNTTRTGSHNLVIGPEHTYTSFGGFVAGLGNTISGGHASVSGGSDNTADGYSASVSGGSGRTALGDYDWVAGDLL